ncbi:hypothetical protein OOT46_26960 [Aquabacterium sp. A7-Y]|uniref:hypothetical protein n=1 Tax=Aquabacterium sp. A7-Y TaxID=1349605 RepID=UPI00223D9A11|nr:hypothetical protein [Aquabacterium sp. A7-Y]MCW7541454.1 hypothetical protein [Aquabacterium sp. A7-Y]
MKTKNAKAITCAELAHLQRVKGLPCSVCGVPGPSEAHHIEQGQHLTVIPLCEDCHRGSINGFHGQRRMWLLTKKTELSCLNETIRKLYAGHLLARSA